VTGAKRGARFRLSRLVMAVLLGAAVSLGLSAGPAAAASSSGWSFQTDVSCHPFTHTVTVRSTGASVLGTGAYTGYQVWLWWNGQWTVAQDWKMMDLRSSYLDYPQALTYTTPGTYTFYVYYAVWADNHWDLMGEYAVHSVESDGFTTPSGISCTA
jgi:hypothetical protein